MNNVTDLFDLTNIDHSSLFDGEFPWEPLARLMAYLEENARSDVRGDVHSAAVVEGRVSIGARTKVDARAVVRGSVLIGEDCFIGGSLVRDSIIESGALIGNGCEIARSIVLKGAKIYHYSGVLDSIVGTDANIGGATQLGNTNLNDSTVHVDWADQRMDTGLMKLGPLIGDNCRFGLGCLLNPGTILGKNSLIGLGVHLTGSHPPRSYVKALQTIRSVVRRPRRERREKR